MRTPPTGAEPMKTGVEQVDEATRASVARESAESYRNFVAKLNRTSDSEIERALQRTVAP
jgi:hypothetical protein